MDYGRRNHGLTSNVFRTFVCVSLTVLLSLHVLAYLWGSGYKAIDVDFSDIKYVVMQLSRGLSDVNRKHEMLQVEMDRISSVVPQVTSGHTKTKDALQTCRHTNEIGEIYEYDRLIIDYALESAGGKVIDTADTEEYVMYESPVGWALHAITSFVCRECLGARAILQPSTLPGECWAFRGSKGEATIRLLGTVKITGFSIEHISPQIAPTREISSAPRQFQVEGLEHRKNTYGHDFGTFSYEKEGKPIQYFAVTHQANKGFNMVRLRILSNWGHQVLTCVYRFRVHGDSLTAPTMKIEEGRYPDVTTRL